MTNEEVLKDLLPSQKYCITVDEAAAYFSIGQNKLRDIIKDNPDLDFLLHKGTQILIKRSLFEDWIDKVRYI